MSKISGWEVYIKRRVFGNYSTEAEAKQVMNELGGLPYKYRKCNKEIFSHPSTQAKAQITRILKPASFIYNHMRYTQTNHKGIPMSGYCKRKKCPAKIYNVRMFQAIELRNIKFEKLAKLESKLES